MHSYNRTSLDRRSRLNSKLLAAVLCLAGLPALQAASGTWTGLGADSSWSTSANWTGATPPGTGGQIATFNDAGNGKTIIDLGAGIPVSNIVFDTANVSAYTIGAGAVGSQTLSLNSNVTMNSTVVTNQLFNANITLNTSGAKIFTNNSTSNTLTFAGAISANTAATPLTITGAGAINISGNITDGTGSLALTKTGAGTLSVSGTNTITGLISAGGGIINVTGGSTTGGAISYTAANSNVTVSGGSLTTTGVTTSGNSNSRTLILNGGTFTSSGSVFASATAGAITINGGTLKSGNVAGITVFDDNNAIAIGGSGATFDTTGGSITLGANATLSTLNNVTVKGASGNTFSANAAALANGNTVGFDLTGVTINNSVSLLTLTAFTVDGGTYNIDFLGFNFDAEGSYKLVGFSSLTGTLLADDFVASNSTVGSGFTGGFVLDGSSLSYVVASAIPEPSAFAVFAGLIVLGFVSLRRRVRI